MVWGYSGTKFLVECGLEWYGLSVVVESCWCDLLVYCDVVRLGWLEGLSCIRISW